MRTLKEFQTIPEFTFEIDDLSFTQATAMGKINSQAGSCKLLRLNGDGEFFLGAEKADKIISCIGFRNVENRYWMAANAWTDPDFMGKGLASEMFLWLANVQEVPIISDTQMTPAGIKLWDKLLNSGGFNTGILYFPTGEIFPKDSVGQTINDIDVKSPADDFFSDQIYDPETEIGQRYFFILMKKEIITRVVEGVEYKFGCTSSKMTANSLLQCYRHFPDGYP